MRARILLAGVVAAVAVALTAVAAGPAAAATVPCFGAPARDPVHPCVNPSTTVSPSVATRNKLFESPCAYRNEGTLTVCLFGVPKPKAKVALLGDSHSWHWRAAVDYVAHHKRWLGYSLTAPGCSFSNAVYFLPLSFVTSCTTWFAQTKAWFARHPEVSTVFVSQLNATPQNPPAGTTSFDLRVAGFTTAWAEFLPKTVKKIVVIADVPDPRQDVFTCIKQVLAARTGNPGTLCATPRAAALTPDVGEAAVKAANTPRVRFVDFRPFFCSVTDCFPVIGGALVYRDVAGHITPAFAGSFGPYLLRRVQLMRLP